MCNIKTKNFQMVEVPVNNTNQRDFNFPLNEDLQKAKKIVGISVYAVANVAVGPVSGLPNVSANVFAVGFIKLYTKEGNSIIIDSRPLSDLNPVVNNGIIREFDIPPLNITKCEVYVTTTANLVANTVFVIGFHYDK